MGGLPFAALPFIRGAHTSRCVEHQALRDVNVMAHVASKL